MRALFVDIDSIAIEEAMKTDVGQLWESIQLVYGNESSIYHSRGVHTKGQNIIDKWIESTLVQAAKWKVIEALLIFHSLSGGTGSGIFFLYVESMYNRLSKSYTVSVSLIPSKVYSSEVIEPYNFILSIHSIIEHWYLNLFFKNQSLFRIWEELIKI